MLKDSEFFEQYVYNRCDVILHQDSETQKLNSQIIKLEKEFQSSLNPEQRRIYINIEELSIKQKEHEGKLLYVSGYIDGENENSK